jgi:superfamily II DNA or RNA helicase
MVILKVNNSYSQIIGLQEADFKSLRTLLSYKTGSYFSGFGIQIKYMIDRRGEFPSGLLHRVQAFLKAVRLPYSLQDKRIQPKAAQGTWKGVKPYKAQAEALKQALNNRRGIISMPTGSGKSFVIALIASRLNVKTLVVVPSLEIRSQLREALAAFKCDMANIAIENIDSAKLKTMTGFDCLIVDEAHHAAAATYRRLNKTAWKGIYYRFMLTATPFRTNTEETLLFEGVAGQVIYELTYKDAVKDGYIVPVEAYYLESPAISNDYYTYNEVYANLIVKNEARNLMIAQTLAALNAEQKSTLCLVKEVAHGETLSKLTGFHFVNGQDEESRKYITMFNKEIIKVLIGTQGVIGEGIDTRPCEFVIIAGIGKAKSAFMQMVGRCLRRFESKKSGKVILIKDKSHKFALTHFRHQCKIMREVYGTKPERLK